MAAAKRVEAIDAEGVVGTNDPVDIDGNPGRSTGICPDRNYLKLKVESFNIKRVSERHRVRFCSGQCSMPANLSEY